MANTLKQVVTQYSLEGIPSRFLVQYENETGEQLQKIIPYEDLTTEEKAAFDAYKAICETKMI